MELAQKKKKKGWHTVLMSLSLVVVVAVLCLSSLYYWYQLEGVSNIRKYSERARGIKEINVSFVKGDCYSIWKRFRGYTYIDDYPTSSW